MKTISLRPFPLRVLFFLAVVAGLGALVWVVVRTVIGDSYLTAVERTPNLSPQARLEGVDTAVSYGARDPLIHLGRGGAYLVAASEEQRDEWLVTALAELRRAAAMNPEDYRAWMSLGRALDRSGELTEAKAALEHAVNLAPRHFDPRWALGNHLFRRGERDAAFAEFRQALAGRPSALPLVFDYAWDAFKGDGRAIAAAMTTPMTDGGETKSHLIALLIARNRMADALAVWRETPKRTEAEAQQVTTAFFNARQMAAAYEVWASTIANRPTPDQDSLLANGDFEKPLTMNAAAPFLTWRIVPIGGIKVSPDRKEPHDGQQALRLSFDVKENIPFTASSQTVLAKPSTNYLLSYWVRTEELRSLSRPYVEVVDATDASRFRAFADPFANGTQQWSEQHITFKTDAKTEAVTVRIQRQPCAEEPCPVNGRIWFDGFKLKEKVK